MKPNHNSSEPIPSLTRGIDDESARMSSYTVIKVGGAVVEDPISLDILLDSFTKIEGPKILVHGGGRLATAMATLCKLETHMVNGRRVTDQEMLKVVTMVYGGLINKQIVAKLQARGINAVGLTGADLDLVRAHRRPITPEGIDFGFVGDVDYADGNSLFQLIFMGATPVIAPLTHDGEGQLLNTNADTMAQTIAVALSKPITDLNYSPEEVTLTFCFELPGVLRDPTDPSTLIPTITESDFRTLVADGTVSGGMIPKLENAFVALHQGVSAVRITNIEDLQGGTVLVKD